MLRTRALYARSLEQGRQQRIRSVVGIDLGILVGEANNDFAGGEVQSMGPTVELPAVGLNRITEIERGLRDTRICKRFGIRGKTDIAGDRSFGPPIHHQVRPDGRDQHQEPNHDNQRESSRALRCGAERSRIHGTMRDGESLRRSSSVSARASC